MSTEPPRNRVAWVGIAITAVGLVVLIPSGLCTAVLYGASTAPGWSNMVLYFGAPAIAVGALIVGFGIALLYRR